LYYFAYASNLNRKQMTERCPNAKPMFQAVLPNYKLIFSGWSREWKGAKASIKPFQGEKVHGAIYEVSDMDLGKLDRYEGYPNEYTHLNVAVFTENGEQVKAVTYIKRQQSDESAPSREYLSVIQQGYKDWHIF